jgi:hypothetical protein
MTTPSDKTDAERIEAESETFSRTQSHLGENYPFIAKYSFRQGVAWRDAFPKPMSSESAKILDDLFNDFKSEFPIGIFSTGDLHAAMREAYQLGQRRSEDGQAMLDKVCAWIRSAEGGSVIENANFTCEIEDAIRAKFEVKK